MQKHNKLNLRIEVDDSDGEGKPNCDTDINQQKNTVQDSILEFKHDLHRNHEQFMHVFNNVQQRHSQYEGDRIKQLPTSQQRAGNNHAHPNIYMKKYDPLDQRYQRVLEVQNRLSRNVRSLSQQYHELSEQLRDSKLSFVSRGSSSVKKNLSKHESSNESIYSRVLKSLKCSKSSRTSSIGASRNKLISQIANKLDQRSYSFSKSKNVGLTHNHQIHSDFGTLRLDDSPLAKNRHQIENNKIKSRLGKLENMLKDIKKINKESRIVVTAQYKGRRQSDHPQMITTHSREKATGNESKINSYKNRLIKKLERGQAQSGRQTPINTFTNSGYPQDSESIRVIDSKVRGLSKMTRELRKAKYQLEELRCTNTRKCRVRDTPVQKTWHEGNIPSSDQQEIKRSTAFNRR